MLIVENLCRSEKYEDVEYNYSYRVIKDQVIFAECEKSEIQSYGIEVERQDIVEGKVIKIERDFVKCISPHRHKVHNLVKVLYDNTVSPLHLLDVLGEYIDQYITDFDEVLKNIYIC
ncbi:DUF6514 family protein [Clostridium ganghwense]|uniref:DUF6514 family protein n=1 Tax=Clostridium ganghwense TaxID=312089 RepID=A0ABT4CQE6_9CLOT|nr:DUF6514 family protein [Clostridium ganghwense]MCY6371286.1 DUF6514 family protein [Clostridium ganghwense]